MERSAIDASSMTAADSAVKLHKNDATLWKRFAETGRIEDYLSFARARADSKQIEPDC